MGKHLSMARTIANHGKLRSKYVLNFRLLMPSYLHGKFLNHLPDGTLLTALCCFQPKIGVKWKIHIYVTFICLWHLIIMLISSYIKQQKLRCQIAPSIKDLLSEKSHALLSSPVDVLQFIELFSRANIDKLMVTLYRETK